MFPTRRSLWWSSTAVIVTGGLAVVFTASARPAALVLRRVIDRASRAKNPSGSRSNVGVSSIRDVHYEPDREDARLDVYFPSSLASGERRPTVVWVHGGAWISGTKEAAGHYFEMLALGGYTVVAVEY